MKIRSAKDYFDMQRGCFLGGHQGEINTIDVLLPSLDEMYQNSDKKQPGSLDDRYYEAMKKLLIIRRERNEKYCNGREIETDNKYFMKGYNDGLSYGVKDVRGFLVIETEDVKYDSPFMREMFDFLETKLQELDKDNSGTGKVLLNMMTKGFFGKDLDELHEAGFTDRAIAMAVDQISA